MKDINLKNQKYYKTIYLLTVVLFILSGLGLGIYYSIHGRISALYMGLATPLFLLVPIIFARMRVIIPYRLLIFFFAFCILAYNIGFIMDGYIILVSYHCDKIDHFISGFLLTTIGLCFFFYMNNSKDKNWKLGIWFALFFTMFIAVLFEFTEYFFI